MKIKLLFSLIFLGSIGSAYGMGETPNEMLLRGAENGDIKLVQKAIEKKANINSKNEHTQTALMWASWNGDESILKLLLDNGANPNIRDCNNHTALMFAAKNGNVSIVKLLLDEEGTSLDLKNNKGKTALDIAKEINYNSIKPKEDIKKINKLLFSIFILGSIESIHNMSETPMIVKLLKNRPIVKLLEDEPERRRKLIQKELVGPGYLIPDLAGIVSEYVGYPKQEKTK